MHLTTFDQVGSWATRILVLWRRVPVFTED